jgi:hypothetical protein
MKNGKGGRWKRFCGFRESKKKGKEPSNRMDEILSLTNSDEESEFIFTDSDGNVIVPNGSKMMEIMHPGYKEHLKEEGF